MNNKLLQSTELIFSDEISRATHARFVVGIFYFTVFTTSVQAFSYFYQFPDWSTLLSSRHLFNPLWSSQWILWFDWEFCVRMILIMHFVGSFIAMILWHRSRWIRIVAFISTFQYLSLISSFGKIDHYMHIMIVAEFMLIFLPNIKDKDSMRQTLKIIFGIQTFILLTYSISGAFKILGIVTQTIAGQSSALSQDAFAHHVARGVLGTNRPTFFSDFIFVHPSWVASIILLTGYVIEVYSFFIIFNPGYQRIWGIVLLIFHSTILMTIGPDFTVQMIVIGIFLVFSPFSQRHYHL